MWLNQFRNKPEIYDRGTPEIRQVGIVRKAYDHMFGHKHGADI